MSARGSGYWLMIAAGVAIVATVVVAIAVMGSPAQQRQIRLDHRRALDLQHIQRAVETYYREHKRLPDGLTSVSSQPGVALDIADPDTGRPYGYRKLGLRSYRLCARFTTDSAGTQAARRGAARMWIDENWPHAAGEACFRREIPGKGEGNAAAALMELEGSTL